MASAAQILTTARRSAGLSQAELARRAGVPRTVINAYERSAREPGAAALQHLLAATGRRLRLGAPAHVPDPERAARTLSQVLDLAASLPTRRRGPTLPPSPFLARR